MRTVPSVGVSKQPRIERRVVLPLPDGPINIVSFPPSSERLMDLTACTCIGPMPSTLLTSTASMIGVIIGPAPPQDRCEQLEQLRH